MVGELRYKGILFGDDLFGTVVDEKPPYKNKHGLMMKEYLIIPTPDLMFCYPNFFNNKEILNVPTPIGMSMWVEYPMIWVHDFNSSRKSAIARIDCRFDGGPTNFTMMNTHKDEEIKRITQENEYYRIALIAEREEKSELIGEKAQHLTKLAELMDIVKGDKNGESEDNLPAGIPPPA